MTAGGMKGRGRALRAIGILLAAGLLSGACAAWWHAAHWEPSAQSYPVQGAWIDARHTARDVLTLAEGGEGGKPLVRFVYATASIGASARNDRFAEERERAGRIKGMDLSSYEESGHCLQIPSSSSIGMRSLRSSFPVEVRGSSSIKWTASGRLKGASSSPKGSSRNYFGPFPR